MAKKAVTTRTADREKFALWLDNDLLKRLRDYQEDVGVPVSVSIRKAIEAFVETLPKAKR
jgi:Ribbon-helix-helix domain